MELFDKAKEAACRVLLEGGISTLPFDVVVLIVANNIKIVKNCDVNNLREGEYAAIIFDGKKWLIVYDEKLPSPEYKRIVLAHELARKVMHHFTYPILSPPVRQYGALVDIPLAEKEAEAFARHLLAPLPVLRELDITHSRDIARICKIPIETAEIQAEILQYYRLSPVGHSPLEKRIVDRFKIFIEHNQTLRAKK